MEIKYLLAVNHVKQFRLIVASQKKWPKNASGQKNDAYEFQKFKRNFQIFCILFSNLLYFFENNFISELNL
jgi:hypothetical protein